MIKFGAVCFFINTNKKKILLTFSKGRSGSAADTQAVADIVHYQLQQYSALYDKPPSAKVAASIFQEICYANKDALTAGIILAGYDEKTKGEVYSIPLGGSLHKQDYAIAGSGSTFIYGFCSENWKPDMEEHEAVEFMKTALAQAIKWDGSSGGVIRMVVLTGEKTERKIFYPEDYARAL